MRMRRCLLTLCVALLLLLLLLPAARRRETQPLTQEFRSPISDAASLRLLRATLGNFSVPSVSCPRLLAGDDAEALKAEKLPPEPPDYRPELHYASLSCDRIRSGYVTQSLSDEEAEFPLAFSLLVFRDFYQVQKLFRAVYRPEHFYCFHVDSKSAQEFHSAVQRYASCFPNVFLTERRVDVQWGRFSVLEPELLCMRQLLAASKEWRYFINLTGQEFPLRTMRELVRILRRLDGANCLENSGQHAGAKPLTVRLSDGSSVPIRWHKGSVHVTVTRQFAEFALGDVGQQVSEHLRLHGSWPPPDETFFATLQYCQELRAPGGDRTGLRTDNVGHPFFNRYKNWMFGVFGYPCLSRRVVRQICIWGVRDLPAMNRRFEFFANKFVFNFQPAALMCMEERFWLNSIADYGAGAKTHSVPLQFYSDFEFVRRHF